MLSNQDMSKSGLEKVGNPIVDFCSRPIDKVVTAIGFQPATQKHQQVLKLRPSSVVAVIDITYYCGDTPAGFAWCICLMRYLTTAMWTWRIQIPFTSIIPGCCPKAACTAMPKSGWDRQGASGKYTEHAGGRPNPDSGGGALFRV